VVIPSEAFLKHTKHVSVCRRARRTTILRPLGVIQQVYAVGVQNLVAAVYVSIMRDLCCQPLTLIIGEAAG